MRRIGCAPLKRARMPARNRSRVARRARIAITVTIAADASQPDQLQCSVSPSRRPVRKARESHSSGMAVGGRS